jgi:hypothetical protein
MGKRFSKVVTHFTYPFGLDKKLGKTILLTFKTNQNVKGFNFLLNSCTVVFPAQL